MKFHAAAAADAAAAAAAASATISAHESDTALSLLPLLHPDPDMLEAGLDLFSYINTFCVQKISNLK